MAAKKTEDKVIPAEANESSIICGLVMPISPIDGCTAEHWSEVKQIISEALEASENFKYEVRLVSDADDVGVIQRRIVQNLYLNDLVVCDVSAKNSNVMFELGMRLAFDKPTIIIKDDKTDYSFDTGIIEHIAYPRDLRFSRINEFKRQLTEKCDQTLRLSKKGGHSTFLKNFGTFKAASIEQQDIPAGKLVVNMLEEMQSEMASLRRRIDVSNVRRRDSYKGSVEGMAKMLSAIHEETNRLPRDEVRRLIDNDSFRDHILDKSGGARFFDSRREFDAAFEVAMKSI